MSPIRVTEEYDEDDDQSVAQLWDDDLYIGVVYWDEETVALHLVSDDAEGMILDALEMADALAQAIPIVAPEGSDFQIELEGLDTAARNAASGPPKNPTDQLVEEFDPLAMHRSPGYEGYFPIRVAMGFVARCNELDLAVARMEGFTISGKDAELVPGLKAKLADAHKGGDWATFRAGCNVQAEALLERWPNKDDFGVAFEVMEPGGETFVA